MPIEPSCSLSRRRFLGASLGAGVAAALATDPSRRVFAETPRALPPVGVFSKVYQELNLSFEESAAVTAEAGLDGIDCPVRPAGQVLPERATEDLPRYAHALAARRLKILLLTTAIQSADTPHAESILRAASKLGVKHYRLGYWSYKPGQPAAARLGEIKAQLKDLAAMNRQLGLCAVLQNHAGKDLVGARLRDYFEIARAFDPRDVAIAFDIGHAIHELGENWRAEFDTLRSRFAVAYVKDWKRGAEFVPFGQGEVGASGFWPMLRQLKYSKPISFHIEYPWQGSQPKTAALLTKAMRSDLAVLREWWNAPSRTPR
ncbi:MAG: sugar phosphate isomerase/epimerase [Verrucomicrobia bacterium]|nr:sugar phosphate isomerase/epimerase [Verrucomicrobiota bacterium]